MIVIPPSDNWTFEPDDIAPVPRSFIIYYLIIAVLVVWALIGIILYGGTE